jgi:hypothetical protein
MATTSKRKPKPEGGRTEIFALRLDPKLKYLAELAARKQRRSLANYVEWALDTVLRETVIDDKTGKKVWEEAELLWDISEPGRFFRLLDTHPELLSYDEQRILFTIKNHTVFQPDFNLTLGFCSDKGKLNKRDITACWQEIAGFSLEPNEDTEKALARKMYAVLGPDY